jgi:hypothetical protein
MDHYIPRIAGCCSLWIKPTRLTNCYQMAELEPIVVETFSLVRRIPLRSVDATMLDNHKLIVPEFR